MEIIQIEKNGIVFVSVKGRTEAELTPELAEVVKQIVEGGKRRLLFDLGALEYLRREVIKPQNTPSSSCLEDWLCLQSEHGLYQFFIMPLGITNNKEVDMLSKVLSRSAISILGWVFFLSLCIGLTGAIAEETPCEDNPCCIYGCPDDCEFTTDFLLDTCKFKSKGFNPYFILKPGYQLVLQTPEDAEEPEKSVETVLCDTKWINLDGRWIKTRVLEERAFEWEEGEDGEVGEWKTVEISLNWFAICKRTNAVYYFGEWSRDCEDGFDENDECEDESNEGSWEAGVEGAKPGLIMPGTPLKGAKYFQEIAEEQEAVDRGEVVDVGLDVAIPGVGSWSDCIEIHDTNPAEAECGDDDVKFYCTGVGLVQDQELVLTEFGFVGCGDDDDDDDDRKWRRKWGHYPHRF